MSLLPWPGDAVMIVAAVEAEFKHAQIRGDPVKVRCRHCDVALLADSWTVRRAETMPERRGRPVLFFCSDCAALHDVQMVTVLEDHRNGHFYRFSSHQQGSHHDDA